MRVFVPDIPQAILSAKTASSKIKAVEAIDRLVNFVGSGNVTVLTGAGVSVDSGIRAYRGHDGRYMNPNYKPILYHELMDETEKGHVFRQRYWLRSYLGYPHIRKTLPNTTHYALAALQYSSVISGIITQNVDGLHQKALHHHWGPVMIQSSITELHGTLHRVRCKRGHFMGRDVFQDWLSIANPKWYHYAQEVERTDTQPRTNPDGDVAIEHLGISYNNFILPDCPTCLSENHRISTHKPEVVFFGESISQEVKKRSFQEIERSDKLLMIGTTLATYSAFRLLRHALHLKKPVMLLNVGPTRADGQDGVEKLDIQSGLVMTHVAKAVIGTRATEDLNIRKMLESGIVKPPTEDDDRTPRAAG